MTTRRFLLYLSLFFTASVAYAQQQPWSPSVAHSLLRGNIHLLKVMHHPEGYVNLVVSVGADGLLLVDHAGDWRTITADAALIDVIRDHLASFNAGEPAFLINTHWHGDHTAGNGVYGEDAVLIAHANTRRRLSERQTPFWYPDGIGPIDVVGWPELTFTDSLSLYFNGEEMQLLHFGAAHTDGDAIVFFREAEVVHMGDLYHGLNGFSVGEDMRGLAYTLAEVIRRIPATTLIVTGHGDVTDLAELRQYHHMLEETIAWVEERMEGGESLDELQQNGLPAPWDERFVDQGDAVSMWIGEIFRSLTQE